MNAADRSQPRRIVYLIRHTTPEVEKGVCYGQLDLPVATSYLDEFEPLAQLIKADPPARFVTSPLLRASKLAHDLARPYGLAPEVDDRLMELDFGRWEGRPWDSIPRHEIDPWGQDFVRKAPPEGESLREMAQRVVSLWEEEVEGRGRVGPIALVCHAGPIRALLCHTLGRPLEQAFEERLSYGALRCLQGRMTGEQWSWSLDGPSLG